MSGCYQIASNKWTMEMVVRHAYQLMERQQFRRNYEWDVILWCSVTKNWHNQWENYRTNSHTRSNKIWRLAIRQNSSKKKWQNWSWTYWNGQRKVRISIQLRCCAPSSIRNWLPNPPIYSIMELRQRFEEEWNGIRQLSYLNLIDSIPDRIQKYLKSFYVELYKFILIFWNKNHVKLKNVLNFWPLE